MRRGKLIVLEGLNGCGKTTQAKRLAHDLDAHYFHETGRQRTSSFPVLFKKLLKTTGMEPITEQYFITGSRAFNLQQIKEILNDECRHIIYDRYVFSSHVYSHRNISYQPKVTDAIWDLHNIIKEDIAPTATIFIDVTPDERERRLWNRSEALDQYEDVPKRLIEYRRNVYLALSGLRKDHHYIDGNNDEETVYGHIRNALANYL